jgi:hypothetical protein
MPELCSRLPMKCRIHFNVRKASRIAAEVTSAAATKFRPPLAPAYPLARERYPVRFHPMPDTRVTDWGSGKQPFVKRDLSRFPVSNRPFRKRAIGNSFCERRRPGRLRDDRPGDLPAIGSFLRRRSGLQTAAKRSYLVSPTRSRPVMNAPQSQAVGLKVRRLTITFLAAFSIGLFGVIVAYGFTH